MFRHSLLKASPARLAPRLSWRAWRPAAARSSSAASGSTAAEQCVQHADRHADGRRYRQADLPALPARPGPGLLQEVRRQHPAVHRAGGRRRRRDRDGLRPGRHGRRLVRPRHRLPGQGQERRQRGPAVRGARGARDVRHGLRRHLARPVAGQEPRRHRHRLRHR